MVPDIEVEQHSAAVAEVAGDDARLAEVAQHAPIADLEENA